MQDVIDLRALDGKEFVCLLLGQTSMYRYCHYVLAKILSFMNFYGSVRLERRAFSNADCHISKSLNACHFLCCYTILGQLLMVEKEQKNSSLS
jgi:hypothetical protein